MRMLDKQMTRYREATERERETDEGHRVEESCTLHLPSRTMNGEPASLPPFIFSSPADSLWLLLWLQCECVCAHTHTHTQRETDLFQSSRNIL